MMEQINISVIIPTYRRSEELGRCLDAVACQTFGHTRMEVVVVSDGPDQATLAVANNIREQYRELNLTCFFLPRQRGPAAARNYGWHRARGKLIVFTDDDCIPSPTWLEAYWGSYLLGSQSLIAFTGAVFVPVPDLPTDYQKNVSHLQTAEFITANCACSRGALESTGGFDETFPIAWREDSDLQFRLLKNHIPIVKVAGAVVQHPVRKAPWGISVAEQRKSIFNALLFKKHPALYKQRISSGPVWRYYIIILSSFVALAALLCGVRWLFAFAGICWLVMLGTWVRRRMKGTNYSFSHRAELMITSVLIPYLSVYWTLRGAWRYKVFFL